MEILDRLCPCGAKAANARGVPRCETCRLKSGRDYQREYKRKEQRRALVIAGLAHGEMVTAICSWCQNEFQFVSLGRKRSKCDQCKKKSGQALSSEWQRRNPERHREIKQRHLKSASGLAVTQAYNLDVARFKKYGVDKAWFERQLEAQGHKCAICGGDQPGGRFGTWNIDHDRSCCPASRSCGKCVRGLLCNGCNILLGHARDDVNILLAAADYLKR